MKKNLAAMLLAIFCVALAPFATADAALSCVETTLPLSVANNTGNAIAAIYIAKTTTGAWSENLISDGIIKNGETIDVYIERGVVFILWDMKIIDTSLGETVIERLPLTDIYELELLPNAETNYYVIKSGT